MGQSWPLFVYFRHFLITISIIEKSIDGVLGVRTRGRRMVGADETTGLWRPPPINLLLGTSCFFTEKTFCSCRLNKIKYQLAVSCVN